MPVLMGSKPKKHNMSYRIPVQTEMLLKSIADIMNVNVTQCMMMIIHEKAARIGLDIDKDSNITYERRKSE